MIVTLTMEEINIQKGNYSCTFSPETLEKLSAGGLLARRKILYKLYIAHRELQLECPVIKTTHRKNIVLWPAIKLPYRKYPIYVYLYAAALYLSSKMSMRSVAAKVRSKFGLDTFSHSTLCRSLKKLMETAPDLLQLVTAEMKKEETTDPALVRRRHWDPARKDRYRMLLTALSLVLIRRKTISFSSLLNYKYFNRTMRFLL